MGLDVLYTLFNTRFKYLNNYTEILPRTAVINILPAILHTCERDYVPVIF